MIRGPQKPIVKSRTRNDVTAGSWLEPVVMLSLSLFSCIVRGINWGGSSILGFAHVDIREQATKVVLLKLQFKDI